MSVFLIFNKYLFNFFFFSHLLHTNVAFAHLIVSLSVRRSAATVTWICRRRIIQFLFLCDEECGLVPRCTWLHSQTSEPAAHRRTKRTAAYVTAPLQHRPLDKAFFVLYICLCMCVCIHNIHVCMFSWSVIVICMIIANSSGPWMCFIIREEHAFIRSLFFEAIKAVQWMQYFHCVIYNWKNASKCWFMCFAMWYHIL